MAHESVAQHVNNSITLASDSGLGTPSEEVVISVKTDSGRFHTWSFNRNGLITHGRRSPDRVEILCPDAGVAPMAHQLVACLNALDVTKPAPARFHTVATVATGGSGDSQALRVRWRV